MGARFSRSMTMRSVCAEAAISIIFPSKRVNKKQKLAVATLVAVLGVGARYLAGKLKRSVHPFLSWFLSPRAQS